MFITTRKNLALHFYLWRSKVNSKGVAPIYLRISIEGFPDAELSSGVFINPSHPGKLCQWDDKRKVVFNHDEADELNNQLSRLKEDIKYCWSFLERSDILVTPAEIKSAYKQKDKPKITFLFAANEWYSAKQEEKLKKRTRDGYKPRFATFKQYLVLQKTPSLLCEQINVDWIRRFHNWLGTRKKRDGKPYHVNYNAKMLDFALTVIEHAYEKGYCRENAGRDYKIPRKSPGKPTYLSMDEVELIEKFEFENARLRKVVDIYLFMCGTGMAHIEMWRFNAEEHIKPTYEGFDWIETDRQKMDKEGEKTGKICYIPIIPLTERILAKYNNVLPKIGNTSDSACSLLNRYLEVAFMLMGMKKATSHTARKTAANMWEELGIPEQVISDCLGNSVAILRKHYLDRSRVVRKKIAKEFKIVY